MAVIEREGRREVSVYDLFGELNERAKPTGIELFKMAGRGWMANGYFFEKESSEFLRSRGEVVVVDEDEKTVHILPSRYEVVKILYLSETLPEWMEPGKKYQFRCPELEDADLDKLWEMRNAIRKELTCRGRSAGEEFGLIGSLAL